MALKKEQLISKFYDEAYAIIELARQGRKRGQEESDQFKKIFDAFKAIPDKSDDANNEDVHDTIMWTSMHLKKPLRDVTKEEFMKYLGSRLLSPPKTYDFYFRLGQTSDFPEGYAVGHGKLCSFANLPDPVKESLRIEYPYRIDEDRAYGGETLEAYKKRREEEWYLHLQVKSVGHFKAREKAIGAAKRSINILKLVYDRHGSLFDRVYSPFDYEFHVEGADWTSGSERQQERQPPFFYRIDYFDQMITDINSMVNSAKPKDLEKRVLNVIDIFGLIDDSTPLHIRFLLCIISLEGLLMHDSEKDYLGWKLGEKVSFLIGDTPAWFMTFHKIKPEERKQVLTEEFMKQNLAKTRSGLDRTIHKFYKKRSGFAHGGLESDADKKITIADYNLASSLLGWTVEKLLELRRTAGIDHIDIRETSTGEDSTSLNYYIEKLKYTN